MVPAFALPNTLSLVTIGERQSAPFKVLLSSGSKEHIAYRADTRTDRNILAAKLDAAVTQADRAVLLVAQGASCFAAAWWARLSPASYVSRVSGAVFLQPVEEEQGGIDQLMRLFASPRIPLPFPSIVLEGDKARGDLSEQVRRLAEGWGSGLAADPVDHAAPRRPWSLTRRAIERFTAGVVERDVQKAERLIGLVRR
ncbi:alpha/beta hydrolase [Sphingomonas sp. CJ20]